MLSREEFRMMSSYTLTILCAVVILDGGVGVSGHRSERVLARSRRVVNGSTTSIENVPWQVSLVYGWGAATLSICGGSIISSNWVITAAHCVSDIMLNPRPLEFISAGALEYAKGSRHMIVDKVRHPFYEVRKETVDVTLHDVALLRVKEPFIFDKTRQPIPLYVRAHATLAQSQAIASGWGATNTEGNDFPFDLKSAIMKLMSVPECEAFLSTVYTRSSVPAGQICATAVSGMICTADSGGPLTVNGTLVGITSWMNSILCPTDQPAVFTEVARYRYWISVITSV